MNMPPAPGPYKLQFFTDKENHLVDQLMELIIPADTHSPGAHAAEVSLFADSMVAASDDGVKNEWREGLRLIEERTAVSPLETVISEAASAEGKPRNELE